MHKAIFSVLILCLLGLSLSCSSDATGAGEKLFSGNCLGCHSESISCLHLDEDRQYWNKTVIRMFRKNNQQAGLKT